MGKPSKAVMEFMEKFGVDSDEIWEVHGKNWVVLHKALERIAAEQKIKFKAPQVVVCDLANKIACVCVSASLGEHEEWSFGEASPANNKNSYPMAMAEKRGKDRVILKLLNVHGALYSEEEADDFRRNPHVTRPADVFEPTEHDENGEVIDNIPTPDPDAVQKIRVTDQRPIFEALQKEIHAIGNTLALAMWGKENKNRLGKLKPDWQEFLRGVYREHMDALRAQEKQDDRRMAS